MGSPSTPTAMIAAPPAVPTISVASLANWISTPGQMVSVAPEVMRTSSERW